MKFEFVHVSRRPQLPHWAILLVFVWLALGGTIVWLNMRLGQPVPFCPFKQFTGLPCPTCGFMRGIHCLLHGQISQAWLYNPLLFAVLALFLADNMVRCIFARCVQINLTHTERIVAWIPTITLFFVNWAYVIFYVG
jgi:hypothetical protein